MNNTVFGYREGVRVPAYLGEVSQDVAPLRVALRHDVEEKRLNVKVERLVIEEELGHQAQALAVHLVQLSVDLEGGDLALAVDLVAGGVAPRADGLERESAVGSLLLKFLSIVTRILAEFTDRCFRIQFSQNVGNFWQRSILLRLDWHEFYFIAKFIQISTQSSVEVLELPTFRLQCCSLFK